MRRMAYDVFLSYSHLDDPNGDGFISQLKKFIEDQGPIFYGKEISVWTDHKICTGTEWEQELLDQLWLSRVFVPVISRSWMNSKWTRNEWNRKFEQVREDFRVGNQTCILPVGYELTEHDIQLLDGVNSLQLKHKFRFQAVLKDEGRQFLKELGRVLERLDRDNQPPVAARGKVFLGMAFSQIMNRWRRILRKHLLVRGFEVVEFNWEIDETEVGTRARADSELKECMAAVHFLDIRGGRYSKGASDGPSLIEIQCVAGDERAKQDGSFFQLFWTGPQDAWDYEERFEGTEGYWEFVEKRSPKATDVDSLKNELLNRLDGLLQRPVPPPVPGIDFSRKTPIACIVYERSDEAVANNIKQYLISRGWQVWLPDPSSTLEAFNDSRLKTFLFYWGSGGEQWCTENFKGLKNARTLNSSPENPPSSVDLYLGATFKPAKKKAKEGRLPLAWAYTPIGNYDWRKDDLEQFISRATGRSAV